MNAASLVSAFARAHVILVAIAACGAVPALGSGCGSEPFADISGSVDGVSLKAANFYWGGPFMVFTNLEGECADVSWVDLGPRFSTGGEPPVADDLVALLFTYNDSDVVEGDNSVAGNAPVDARLIVIEDAAMTVTLAEEGSIDITALDKEEGNAAGTFGLTFENGSLDGDFDVEWCNNLKGDR